MSKAPLSSPVFRKISRIALSEGVKAYVIGGYVRDYYLHRPSSDIDIVIVGSGIAVAEKLAEELGTRLTVFRTYGTAMLQAYGMEIEFVGARKESYTPQSRNPRVESGTLEDDQLRRDFTINAMAWSLNEENFGELVDPFDGMHDLENLIIRTPTDADVTFSDDPLRMMRGVRFASQLGFDLDSETFDAIKRNARRMSIITKERISVELNKILSSDRPSIGLELMEMTGLMQEILPEIHNLCGVERHGGLAHKDNFKHTMQVLDNVSRRSDNLWLRWAALLHDVAKPVTKSFDSSTGFSFHGHNVVGSKMAKSIFIRLKLPLGETLKYVQKMIFLHMRPIALVEDEVTDSAVRRLLFEASDDIDDLMLLAEADITSAQRAKVERALANMCLVREKLKDIEEKDRIRNFRIPINGDMIMQEFDVEPSQILAQIKEEVKNAILDGKIPNEYDPAHELMCRLAEEYGLKHR
ncbi:MAG: HD domain-containing protein [Alistipes sp.]|nr:HD domain-containing protein [Candidatus Alistipes equi]